MIPVLLITGFLGSGKTTLLQHLLRDARQRPLNTALIVNEFGSADVDGELLRGASAEQLATLSGGCACCAGQDEFVAVLQELGSRPAHSRPDVIVVEASGLADVLLLLDNLTLPELQTLVRPQTLVAVLDALRFQEVWGLAPHLVRSQVELADFLVLNKVDEVPPERERLLLQQLKTDNESATLVATRYAEMDFEVVWQAVLQGGAPEYPRASSPPASGPHLGAHSVVCPVPHPVERDRLEKALAALPDNVWRCKGFVRVRGQAGVQLLQYSGGPDRRWHLAPFYLDAMAEEPEQQLVFLGTQLSETGLKQNFGGHALANFY